jgi:hypothetical protein
MTCLGKGTLALGALDECELVLGYYALKSWMDGWMDGHRVPKYFIKKVAKWNAFNN